MEQNESSIYRMVVRTKKEDSVFLYNILEANEGLAAYSTVNYQVGNPNRDVELLIPVSLVKDVKELLLLMKDVVWVLEG